MSSIANYSESSFLPVSYTTKAGKIKTAHNEVSAAFAPAKVRKQEAHSASLNQLKTGIYRPTLAATAVLMTKGDKSAIKAVGYDLSENPSKASVVAFVRCLSNLWDNAKGERAAQAALLKEFVEWVDVKEKASTVPPAVTQ